MPFRIKCCNLHNICELLKFLPNKAVKTFLIWRHKITVAIFAFPFLGPILRVNKVAGSQKYAYVNWEALVVVFLNFSCLSRICTCACFESASPEPLVSSSDAGRKPFCWLQCFLFCFKILEVSWLVTSGHGSDPLWRLHWSVPLPHRHRVRVRVLLKWVVSSINTFLLTFTGWCTIVGGNTHWWSDAKKEYQSRLMHSYEYTDSTPIPQKIPRDPNHHFVV